MSKINEKELDALFLELKKDNSEIAFQKLYTKYNKLIYGIAFSFVKNKEDAEDMVQIFFSKLYTMEKEKLPNENPASWIYTVTKNETISLLRKKKNDFDLETIYEIEDKHDEINNIIDKVEFNRLISKLDDKEKEIVALKILTNLSFEEIAKLLNKPSGTVKWRYYKAIHTLKLLLSNLGMFVISFISSIIAFKNGAKNSDLIKEEVSDTQDNNLIEDEEIKGSPTEEKKENTFLDDKEEQIQENVIIDAPVQNNISYIGIGFMGISSFFFIITIFFSIIFAKHQLKRRKKLSK